jgi:hypothetical protein
MAGFVDRPQIMACTMAACLAELSQKVKTNIQFFHFFTSKLLKITDHLL